MRCVAYLSTTWKLARHSVQGGANTFFQFVNIPAIFFFQK